MQMLSRNSPLKEGKQSKNENKIKRESKQNQQEKKRNDVDQEDDINPTNVRNFQSFF